jgi:hypothetical protein
MVALVALDLQPFRNALPALWFYFFIQYETIDP